MISVILPTYNRFAIVEETIRKMLTLPDNIPFEIIVVNDGEPLPFHIEHPQLHLLKNPQRGAASARNFGAANARYDILFFIDDDMWITEESLIAVRKTFDENILKTGCLILNWQYPDSLVQEMSVHKIGRYLLRSHYHTLEGRLNKTADHSLPFFQIRSMGSGSFVITKELFYRVGQYNENILFQGEDIELSEKLNHAGIPIFLYTPVTCFHNQKDRLDITGFLDRDYRGYLSQFKQKDAGETIAPDKIKKVVFTLLMPFKSLFLFVFKYIPNKKSFDIITFRIIGTLSSISYFKAMYDARKR